MRTNLATVFIACGILMLSTVQVLAHHAFAAEFDAKRPVNLAGVVSKVEWVNPHSWVHVDVKKPDGSVETWMIEAGSPNALFRRGITRESLPVGTEIRVDGFQAKDGTRRANGRNVTLANGRMLFLGSSGTGAPLDGTDPEKR